jgi:hypothetical protein
MSAQSDLESDKEFQVPPEMRAALDKSARMYNWNEEAIPWLEAFVRVHNTIYRGETKWPDRLIYQFTTFPSWVWDNFDAAAGFNNPELSLHKIAWALMEAKSWSVSIGGGHGRLRICSPL